MIFSRKPQRNVGTEKCRKKAVKGEVWNKNDTSSINFFHLHIFQRPKWRLYGTLVYHISQHTKSNITSKWYQKYLLEEPIRVRS